MDEEWKWKEEEEENEQSQFVVPGPKRPIENLTEINTPIYTFLPSALPYYRPRYNNNKHHGSENNFKMLIWEVKIIKYEIRFNLEHFMLCYKSRGRNS